MDEIKKNKKKFSLRLTYINILGWIIKDDNNNNKTRLIDIDG